MNFPDSFKKNMQNTSLITKYRRITTTVIVSKTMNSFPSLVSRSFSILFSCNSSFLLSPYYELSRFLKICKTSLITKYRRITIPIESVSKSSLFSRSLSILLSCNLFFLPSPSILLSIFRLLQY